MKELPLTNSTLVALVDDDDYERVACLRWQLNRRYVRSTTRRQGNTFWLLHRFILNPPANTSVDHINQNRLDCRRTNLRLATRAENGWNRGKPKHNTSGYKGVKIVSGSSKTSKQWEARIRHNGEFYYLGTFFIPEDAARAYDEAAIRLHGEFACLNFPTESRMQS